MGTHDNTSEFSNREPSPRRLQAIQRLRRMRRERHSWRWVAGGLLAAVTAGSILATVTGQGAASEPESAVSTEAVDLTQASWKVDAVIDEIDAEREAAQQAAEEEAARIAAEEEAAKKAEEEAEKKAEEEAKKKAEEEAAKEAEEEAARKAAEEAARPDWISPSDARLTSYYGERWGRLHAGLDFANNTNDPIWAIADGTVVYAGWMDGYGNLVVIDHGDGVETAYGHANEVLVGVGQKVSQGDKVSLTGSTGNSTGPHLHFEVRINGTQVDPLPWLADRDIDLG